MQFFLSKNPSNCRALRHRASMHAPNWLLLAVSAFFYFASTSFIAAQSSTANVVASSPKDVAAEFALTQRGSVTFRETPLPEVILILSQQWNVNIIAGGDITGQVNGTFKDETLKSILDSILISNNLQFRQIGNSLVVLPQADVGGNRSNFRVEVLDANAGTAEEMEELITALKLQMSSDGQLVPISATGKLTILDTPERIEAVRALLAQISPPSAAPSSYVSTNLPDTTATQNQNLPPQAALIVPSALELKPQFVLAKDLQQPLTMIVGAENISVVEQENTLVVFGDPAAQQKAKLLMQQLDKPRPQVRITGYIYDVDLGELEKLGVDWGQRAMSTGVDANGVPNNLQMGGSGLLTPAAITNSANTLSGVVTDTASTTTGAAATVAAAPGGQFLFRTLSSGFELQTLIQALDETKGSRLLADPHVTVVDRHLASLGIVTQIPVQQLTQTQQGGSIGSTSFKDAGITLDVTPHISNDGTIEMEVAPTFSVLTGFQNGNPVIDTRRASTVVRVTHGQALVIGGLRSKRTVETVKGIPGLMNIKYIGAMFRAHDTDVRESELIVFIMPEIVGYCGGLEREMEALDVTQKQLSCVQTAVNGAFTPDCRDCFCPQHNPRPRIHNGMQDVGLIGNHDMVFINPMPAADVQAWAAPLEPAQQAPVQQAQPMLPDNAQPAVAPLRVVPTPNVEAPEFKGDLSLRASTSSRRVPARTVGYRR